MCPKPRVRGDKPQGSTVPHQIADLMAPDWWAVQAPTTSVEECVSPSPRLPLSASGASLLDIGITQWRFHAFIRASTSAIEFEV